MYIEESRRAIRREWYICILPNRLLKKKRRSYMQKWRNLLGDVRVGWKKRNRARKKDWRACWDLREAILLNLWGVLTIITFPGKTPGDVDCPSSTWCEAFSVTQHSNKYQFPIQHETQQVPQNAVRTLSGWTFMKIYMYRTKKKPTICPFFLQYNASPRSGNCKTQAIAILVKYNDSIFQNNIQHEFGRNINHLR